MHHICYGKQSESISPVWTQFPIRTDLSDFKQEPELFDFVKTF